MNAWACKILNNTQNLIGKGAFSGIGNQFTGSNAPGSNQIKAQSEYTSHALSL